MISAFRGSFLYPFDVVLKIFGFRFSLGRCHEKVEISMKMSSFHAKKIDFTKMSRFHEKKIKFGRGGLLLLSIQSGAVRA